jgi:hypothetical protein
MKIMPISFDPEKEPLLAKVVIRCRRKGNLAEAQKTALTYDQLLDATLMDPAATEQEKLDAIALVQGFINSHQRVIDLYMREGRAPSTIKEDCDEDDGVFDAY